jgi:drug/metabolite transporter (DMT)-like permease
MLTDLAVLSRADLTYVMPVAASSNVLIAIGGHFWLHEHISSGRWLGILIISISVLLAETTPDRTTPPSSERL